MRRRVLVIFSVMLAALAVTLATLPFWLGAAAEKIGGRYGLSFARYERAGYWRFVLSEVEFRRGQTRVTLARAEADTPLLWLWHRWTAGANLITGTTWRVDVTRAPEVTAPVAAQSQSGGWEPLRAILHRVADQLERWLPEAKVGAGVVQWPTGELTLAGAEWSRRELAVEELVYRAVHISGRAAFPRGQGTIQASVRGAEPGDTLVLESRENRVTGKITWSGQPADIASEFAPSGWLPKQASVQADPVEISGQRLRVAQLYSMVRGHARLDWTVDHFNTDIVLKGEPLPGKEAVPPLDLDLRAQGDRESVTIQSLLANLPGIKARLSAPVTIQGGAIRGEKAQFTIEADLAQQPWFDAQGQVKGEARLASDLAQTPEIEYQLEARNVASDQLSLSSVDAKGRFRWPTLELSAATIVGGEGERLTLQGRWNFADKVIQDGHVEGEIRRRSIARWLPAQPEFDGVVFKAELSGAVADLQHRGTAHAAGMQVKPLNPFIADIEWKGHGATIDSFSGTATAASSTVRVAGAVNRTELVLNELTLAQAEQMRLQLKERATIRWRPALEFESVHLGGPEGSLDGNVVWGDQGRIEIAARNLNPAWFEDLITGNPFKWQLTLLAVTGTWDRGPLTFSISGGVQVDMGEGHLAAVMTAARGSKDGIRVEALRATEGEATVFNASGMVPVVIFPRGPSLVHIDPDGEIALEATAAPHATFWDQLATATGVELKEPQATARVKGTWLRPEGEIRLAAARIAVDPERFKRPLPELTELNVLMTGARDGVRLETFSLRIEGQQLNAQGRLPIPEDKWSEVLKQPLELARRGANLRLEIPGADLAAFARFLPAFVAPKGQLQVDLTYKDAGFDGALRLRDAASRPLGPLGVLQEISADVQMAGRTFELRNVSARSGGQPVNLTGKVDVPDGGRPRYDLTLRGNNLPFVRQAGLLLRGDLDLKLQTPANGEPRISGTVRLRDSLFLSDVRSFLPQGAATAMRRPPYFAVQVAPLDSWGLAVDVSGDRFLRLRTPVFIGVASARFRLSGTLGEPRAIGEATVEEGLVLMPFASFDIRQGAVRLTEADPFAPTVFMRGTGRRFGYDLTMELDGAAASPNLILSSSPALDSEQVLQMVMTGAPPTDEITFSSTQRATRIGTFLGQSLLGSLGTEAANADRLSIASGEKISRQGKETYEVEYKLSDRLSVMGEYNEFDEHNAVVKWRIFPRQKHETEEKADAKK